MNENTNIITEKVMDEMSDAVVTEVEEMAKQPNKFMSVLKNTGKGLVYGAAIYGAVDLTVRGIKWGKKKVAEHKKAKSNKDNKADLTVVDAEVVDEKSDAVNE